MPNCTLLTTPHFDIVWWPRADSRGLYINRLEGDFLEGTSTTLMTKGYAMLCERETHQCFVDLEFVPSLIEELRAASSNTTLLSRVRSPFVPVFHRRPKKDGGDPALAYYTPLEVKGEERAGLADALEVACSKDNVSLVEARISSDSYTVLDNRYLENGIWRSMYDGEVSYLSRTLPSNVTELPANQLAQAPRQRFRAPTGNVNGQGTTTLRTAKAKHKCWKRGCIDYAWIKSDQTYLEHRQGGRVERYHLKCAFRAGLIPTNWLSPHFEQYYALVGLGFTNWIEKEREKRKDYEEEAEVPTNASYVSKFVQKVESGYELDEHERRDWREYLHYVPVDVEPFQTARQIVGLTRPKIRLNSKQAHPSTAQ